MNQDARHEGGWREKAVEALVEVRVLQAVLGHEHEDAVQRQHAQQAAQVQRLEQEVCQQQRASHVWNDACVHPHQHLPFKLQCFSLIKSLQPPCSAFRCVEFCEQIVSLGQRIGHENNVHVHFQLHLAAEIKTEMLIGIICLITVHSQHGLKIHRHGQRISSGIMPCVRCPCASFLSHAEDTVILD